MKLIAYDYKIKKLPSKAIVERNREIRKKFISGEKIEDLCEMYELGDATIRDILKRHEGGDLTPDKVLEKAYRINRLKQLHKEVEGTIIKRDEIDIIQELREEIEGKDKGNVNVLSVTQEMNISFNKEQEEYVLERLKECNIRDIV